MPRKKVESGGKKDQIIKAALELFMRNGYEKTSIRMIQKEVGSEVGLFYYYFKDKDAVFEQALNLFFSKYKKDLEKLVEEGKNNPRVIIDNFFKYIHQETLKFREEYELDLHWSVRRAIREQALEVIEPYLRQAVDIFIGNGATPRVDKDVVVMLLTHGVAGLIIREEDKNYLHKIGDIAKGIRFIMGLNI